MEGEEAEKRIRRRAASFKKRGLVRVKRETEGGFVMGGGGGGSRKERVTKGVTCELSREMDPMS